MLCQHTPQHQKGGEPNVRPSDLHNTRETFAGVREADSCLIRQRCATRSSAAAWSNRDVSTGQMASLGEVCTRAR